MLRHRSLLSGAIAVVLVPLAITHSPVSADPGTSSVRTAAVAIEWQRLAVRTIYVESTPSPAPPVGALYLSFTSLAVHDAAKTSLRGGKSSEAAAIAVAAHDVLHHWFPNSRSNLDARLAATLASIPDGAAEDRGVAIGHAAATEMISSRDSDGRNDPAVIYAKPDVPGVWQPAPGAVMAAAWLGFVKPVVLQSPVSLDGPDALTSPAYAAEWDEVRRLGSTSSVERTAEQTAIAQFFTTNPVVMYRDALFRHLDQNPLGLRATTLLFARLDAAAADTFIQAWRLKYDLGYWRPFEAIAEADTDGNDATEPESGWVPLVSNPSYSDYTSGHAAATSSFAQVVRTMLGDHVPLSLIGASTTRSYSSLTALEHDALNARIWGGLHFRDAMDDGYLLGHETADRVVSLVH